MSECLPDLPRYLRQQGSEWQGADHPDGPWRPIPAPVAGLPWPTDGPAVPESREPAFVAPEANGPRPLSPAAQAVLDAVTAELDWDARYHSHSAATAAIRALADQMLKQGDLLDTVEDSIRGSERHHQAGWLNRVAAELEGADG